jgi:hypothetical protein
LIICRHTAKVSSRAFPLSLCLFLCLCLSLTHTILVSLAPAAQPERPLEYVAVSFLVPEGKIVCDINVDRPCQCSDPCPGIYPTREGEEAIVSRFRERPGMYSKWSYKRPQLVEWLNEQPQMYAVYFDVPEDKPVCPLEEFRPCKCRDLCPGIYPNVREEGKGLFGVHKKKPNFRFAKEPFPTVNEEAAGGPHLSVFERGLAWLRHCRDVRDQVHEAAPAVEQERAAKPVEEAAESSVMGHMREFASSGNVKS